MRAWRTTKEASKRSPLEVEEGEVVAEVVVLVKRWQRSDTIS